LQHQSSLSPDVVKARLMKTANKSFPTASVTVDSTTGKAYPAVYDIYTVGAGYLDIPDAINNNDTTSKTALSPSVVYNTAVGQSLLTKDASALWDNGVWSMPNVWGPQVLEPLSKSWATTAGLKSTSSLLSGVMSLLGLTPTTTTNSATTAAWGSTA